MNLTQASKELFRRTPDERFESLTSLWEYCHHRRERSTDRWQPPLSLIPNTEADQLRLTVGHDGAFALNDWSFAQLCKMAGVAKETVNRLSADTASRVFRETMPSGNKPLQILTSEEIVRSLHGVTYTRLWDADLLIMLREFAVDFTPPPKAFDGSTGLYSGEQDLFVFMIDPTGWAEIGDEAFTPGFFVWNSEVGKRSVGVSTFWFQQVCQNHIVWDATEVVEFTRKHTASVHGSIAEIRQIIEALIAKRDERKDGFVRVIKRAMETKLGDDAPEVEALLAKSGIARVLAKRALELTHERGERFTLWSVVDALTQLARELPNAGDRNDADQKASSLLALAR